MTARGSDDGPHPSEPGLGETLMRFAVAGASMFVVTAGLVVLRASENYDRSSILSMRRLGDPGAVVGPDWLGLLLRDVTALGGTPIVTLLTAMLAGYLLVRRRWRSCIVVIVIVAGQALLIDLLKQAFDRPRPDLVPALADVSSRSFPSGHAASAASICLLLAALTAKSLPTSAARVYALLCAGIVALLIGLSRVALGVHYPTDVLAGWGFGAAWTAACLLAARRLERL